MRARAARWWWLAAALLALPLGLTGCGGPERPSVSVGMFDNFYGFTASSPKQPRRGPALIVTPESSTSSGPVPAVDPLRARLALPACL
jgi:hypothetical protein